MYLNSSKYIKAIKNDSREMFARVTINDVVYEDELINNIEFTSSAMSGKEFSIGSTHENAVSIVFSEVINTVAPLDRVIVEIGVRREPFEGPLKNVTDVRMGQMRMGTRLNLWNSREDIEYTLMGEFYISDHVDVNYNDKITTIECKDKMIFMEDDYNSELTYPADIREVIVEIANLAGVEIDALNIEELEYIEVMELEGYTYRQALGYLAQLLVGYVYFNRKGYLQIRQLEESDYEISTEEYYSKGLTKNGIRYRVQGITCTVPTDAEPQELFVGSKIGTQLQIENPLMTEHRLQIIYDKLQNIDYYPYDLEWRGNPAIEVGDMITVYDVENNELKVPNLNYSLTYTGGLTAKSSADTESQTDIVASGRPTLKQQIITTQKKITETATRLEDAFKDAQARITGNQGGHIVQRMNEDGKPYEFLVMDTEDINSATNVIRLNQQGIGFSQNGYNGPFGVAITIDGQIVADYITAGTLSAELIQSGFNRIVAGTSITQEGIRQVDASGEYAIMAGGGMRFYTALDTLNGSIESSYQGSESSGGETGVGIFIEPGRKFNLVRHYPGSEDNVTIFDVPIDADELRLRRNLNAYSRSIYDATSIRTRNDINEAVFFTSSTGEGYLGGTNGVRLGHSDSGSYYTALTIPKSGDIKSYRNIDMNSYDIRNGNIHDVTLNLGGRNITGFNTISSHSDGHMIFGADRADDHTGHKPLVVSGGGTLILSASGQGLMRLHKYSGGGTGISVFSNLNMEGYTITNQSDIRLKKEIKDSPVNALKEIDRLRFVEYEWDTEKGRNKNKPKGKQFGLIAQYSPFLQTKASGEDSYLSIDMMKQVNLNSKGIQELYHENIALKERIEALEAI